ncbi:hypothetical protein F5Y04DRAFT_250954 [Hypomontagnella monticulosa]|nr:hypothetical protein F5Y04DRAFT_250954 [Hypomontagnella monticulosa]
MYVEIRCPWIGHSDASQHRRSQQSIESADETQGDEVIAKPTVVPFRSHSEPSSVQTLHSNSQDDRKYSTVTEDLLVTPDFSQPLPLSRQNSRSKDFSDPLGLSLIHGTPECEADIILVHGLGGSSWRTWSWERQPDVFWPEWLRHEDGLSHFRVFTYGYNANFMDSKNPLSILDFSKGLLIRMKTYGNGDLDYIGMKPIIFVAHSMGGLVVKKALVIGKNDNLFSVMLSKVRGIMFLSTPHKGSPHARTLNSFLSIMAGRSSKIYISELDGSSTSIEDANEQFRAICGSWRLFSLYETLPTRLMSGVRRIIVSKDSGVLNYPGEVSVPVNADHHTISKYSNRLDPNYLLVTNLLRQLTQDLRPQGDKEARGLHLERPAKLLETIFGIEGNTREDFDRNTSRALPNSCQWLYQCESFKNWLDASHDTNNVLWLTGPPGTGKSILAAKTIEHIQTAIQCQYHFFVDGLPTKRSAAYCLRAIAFQLATMFPALAEKMIQLHEDTQFSAVSSKSQIIWDTVFENIIFKMDFGSTLHWVIDGLDEGDAPVSLVRHFTHMQSRTPIKLLLFSRPLRELTSIASSRPDTFVVEPISINHTTADIRDYIGSVASEILPSNDSIKEYVVGQLADRAEGSFLWTKLALDSLWNNWHTKADIEKALNEVPQDMQALYQRMIDYVKDQPTRLREIAFRVLTWAACAFRPLTITELVAALEPEFDGFINLGETVVQICGQFIRVDNGAISLVHGTARKFLLHSTGQTPAAVGFHAGHEHLATVCLQYLSRDSWRQALARISQYRATIACDQLEPLYEEFPFLRYAINFWAYHVSEASVSATALLLNLRLFCHRYILQWIQLVALSNNIPAIPRAAQYLKKWLRRRKKMGFSEHPLIDTSSSAETQFLQQWATDLIRVVGKFGSNLLQSPSTIHKHIPPFCPRDSIIARTYAQQENPLISVEGISSNHWDDHLGRLSPGEDEIVSVIRCAGMFCFTLVARHGTVIVWHIETCQELRRFCHEEWVTLMETNQTGTLVATSGRMTNRIWDPASGQQLHVLPKDVQARPLSLNFAKADSQLVIGYDDCSVLSYELDSFVTSTIFAAQGQGILSNCPRFTVLSPDQASLAIGFRGRPVLIREKTTYRAGSRTIIRLDDKDRLDNGSDVFNSPEIARWHPDGSSLYILYQDTTILVWNLIDDAQTEYGDTEAREMVLNSDGTCLLTSSNSGSISVWGLPKFNLIYRLQFDEFVRDLTFSPDGERILDVRGSGCNVWAPDVLIRPDELEREETSSSFDGSSVSEVVSETVFAEDRGQNDIITALYCDNEDEFFCCGRDDGSVSIHEIKHGKRVRKVSNHATTADITTIAWSRSRRFLASADDSGKVIAKRLRIKEDGNWAVYRLFELRTEEVASQMLFSPDEALLLISTDTTDLVWDVNRKVEVCRIKEPRTGRKWVCHPSDEGKLIWLGPQQLRIHEWVSLSLIETRGIEPTENIHDVDEESGLAAPNNLGESTRETVNIIITPISSRYLLCETLSEQGLARGTLARSMKLDVIRISDSSARDEASISRTPLIDVASEVRCLLGIYRERIVFLDHGNWLCTWTIGQDVGLVKRQFFLPRDWVNESTLRLLRLNQNGTLLCARNNEVAIVRYLKGF